MSIVIENHYPYHADHPNVRTKRLDIASDMRDKTGFRCQKIEGDLKLGRRIVIPDDMEQNPRL